MPPCSASISTSASAAIRAAGSSFTKTSPRRSSPAWWICRVRSPGDPLSPDTQVGAIVTPEHNARIHGYVQAVAAGARVALGGAALPVPGLGAQFYQPTVICDVTPDMAIARDAVFGPVLSVPDPARWIRRCRW